MEPYRRKTPAFSLCGLNCCLCPRFHTDGPSRCPGCGGEDFELKHPSCGVISCGKKHGSVEYCFECEDYPCRRYAGAGKCDSFISYAHVKSNFSRAKQDTAAYLEELKRKYEYLSEFIARYNDGRSKGFYCLAVDLLPLDAVEQVIREARSMDSREELEIKEKVKKIKRLFEDQANRQGIVLELRKPPA